MKNQTIQNDFANQKTKQTLALLKKFFAADKFLK